MAKSNLKLSAQQIVEYIEEYTANLVHFTDTIEDVEPNRYMLIGFLECLRCGLKAINSAEKQKYLAKFDQAAEDKLQEAKSC